MHKLRQARIRGRQRHGAITIVETVISLVIVSGMLVAAMNLTSAVKRDRTTFARIGRGHYLAASLLWEIMSRAYEDPEAAQQESDYLLSDLIDLVDQPTLGPDTGESTRDDFDDVDDYADYEESPPVDINGDSIGLTANWKRSVTVNWVTAANLGILSVNATGLKRITVTASYSGIDVATVTAVKSVGLPSDDLVRVLLVVDDPTTLTTAEAKRQSLIEGFGYRVDLIDAGSSKTEFTRDAADADAIYVPSSAATAALAATITDLDIGIVNEHPANIAGLGFTSAVIFYTSASSMEVIEPTHPVVTDLGTVVTLFKTDQPIIAYNGTGAAGLTIIANQGSSHTLYALDTGDIRVDARAAPNRRVQLPWGMDFVDLEQLTAEGTSLMHNAVAWAAGELNDVPTCGNGWCEDGESTCDCEADCGAPDANEVALSTCSDGIDNDCDGNTDCDDTLDCALAPGCLLSICGNLTCEPGEDCNSCPLDCPAVRLGKPSVQHCCGNGILEDAEGSGAVCDGNP